MIFLLKIIKRYPIYEITYNTTFNPKS